MIVCGIGAGSALDSDSHSAWWYTGSVPARRWTQTWGWWIHFSGSIRHLLRGISLEGHSEQSAGSLNQLVTLIQRRVKHEQNDKMVIIMWTKKANTYSILCGRLVGWCLFWVVFAGGIGLCCWILSELHRSWFTWVFRAHVISSRAWVMVR
jgi:hypothetical protein